LYGLWQERYAAKTVQDRKRAKLDIMRHAEDQAKKNEHRVLRNLWRRAFLSPAAAFRCVCGAETKNPLDPAWMAEHKPHVEKAALKATAEAIQRWRQEPV